jgi:hypothetical protein
LSDTAFIQQPGRTGVRVQLTMDVDEINALALVCLAAIDASVLLDGHVTEETAHNSEVVFNWAMSVARTLEASRSAREAADGQE